MDTKIIAKGVIFSVITALIANIAAFYIWALKTNLFKPCFMLKGEGVCQSFIHFWVIIAAFIITLTAYLIWKSKK